MMSGKRSVFVVLMPLFVGVLVAAAAFAATGASRAAGTRTGEAQLAGELSVLYSSDFKMNTAELTTRFWNQVKAKFESAYPGATLNLIGVPGNANDVANAAALRFRSASTAPDVLEFNTAFASQFAASGFTRPLNKYLASSTTAPFWMRVPPGIKALGRVRKNIYALPTGYNVTGILYNKAMLRRAGVTLPWTPKSWTDILRTARKVKDANPNVIPFWLPAGVAGGAGIMLQGTGNLIFGSQTPVMLDPKTRKWVVDSPGLRQTFSMYKSIFGSGLGQPLSYVVRNDSVAQPVGLLQRKELAIAMGANWMPTHWVNRATDEYWPTASKEIGVAPIPTRIGQGAGAVSAVGGWGVAMSRTTKNPDLAWALIKLLESPEFLLKNALWAGHIPPDAVVGNTKAFVNYAPPFQALYNSFGKYGKPLPGDPDYPVYVRSVGVVTDAIAKDPSMSIDSAIRLLSDTAAQQLGREKVISVP